MGGELGDMYMYGWAPSLFTQNCHNIVNWLYPLQNKKFKKKTQNLCLEEVDKEKNIFYSL